MFMVKKFMLNQPVKGILKFLNFKTYICDYRKLIHERTK